MFTKFFFYSIIWMVIIMPSWSIHLKIGKELVKELGLDKDKFLFGSLLPDTDYDWKVNRNLAHYYGKLKFPRCPSEDMVDIDGFINDYKDYLYDDLIKGYYAHLLADHYYNEYIYYNKWVQRDGKLVGVKTVKGDIIDVEDHYKLAARPKHRDLELYGKRLFLKEKIVFPEDEMKIIKYIDLLKDNFINKDNVIKRIKYLHSDYIDYFLKIREGEKGSKYKLFTEDELDNLLNGCIEYILEKLKELE